ASNYDVGKVIGLECGKWVAENEGSKKVALCSYSPLDFLVEREKGMRDGFAEACPDGEIAIALDAGFTPDGVVAGENFLQAVPDLQAVMGINDGGTLGVYEAFKAAGMTLEKNKVGIFGCDASEDGINAIKKNDMFLCTIDLDLVNQVSGLYERCVEAAKGGKIDETKAVVTYPVNPVYIGDLK
ncbi:MAG: substrate-binding domain-containing protein, partial [Oscillospiraceae bacterium]